eukprot:gene33281-41068_t
MYLKDRCSFARMSMVAVENEKGEAEDAIVLLGDENVYQFRWNTISQELFKVSVWTREYRRMFEGTFPGTGPATFNNQVYFTDNTFPIYLHGDSYSMFKVDLLTHGDGKQILTSDYQSLSLVNAAARAIDSADLSERVMYHPGRFEKLE